jgi:hypothetical protein
VCVSKDLCHSQCMYNITSVRYTHIYKHTIIYKICCKDVTVTDIYVGHTTNFDKRKFYHMRDTLTSSAKVYEFIRSHGGWDNWDMTVLQEYSCDNYDQACMMEWFWWRLLGATLNVVTPGNKIVRQERKKRVDFETCINDMELSHRVMN